jgi:hypothetical protein
LKVSVGAMSEMRNVPIQFAIVVNSIKQCLQTKMIVACSPMRPDRGENLQRNTKNDGAQCRESMATPLLLIQT